MAYNIFMTDVEKFSVCLDLMRKAAEAGDRVFSDGNIEAGARIFFRYITGKDFNLGGDR
jgi:propanediol dehydratase large subunit